LPRRGHTVAATEVVLLRVLSSGAFRGLGRAPDLSWHGEPLRRLDEADPGKGTPPLGDHHPRALQGVLRPRGRGTQGTRHPRGSERFLVRSAQRDRGGGLADRGLPSRTIDRGHRDSREGPLRGCARSSGSMNVMNTLPVSAMVLADLTELNTDLVTPGVLGFLVIFGIALVLYFLMRSMTSKLTPLA